VGGKLAQIGSRLIDSVTKKLAAQFFTSLVEKLSPDDATDAEPQSAESTESAPATATPAAAAASAPKRGIPTPIWAIGIIGVVAVLILWAVGVF